MTRYTYHGTYFRSCSTILEKDGSIYFILAMSLCGTLEEETISAFKDEK